MASHAAGEGGRQHRALHYGVGQWGGRSRAACLEVLPPACAVCVQAVTTLPDLPPRRPPTPRSTPPSSPPCAAATSTTSPPCSR